MATKTGLIEQPAGAYLADDRPRPLDGLWHLGAPITTEDEVRLLELQLADIKRQIAYHESAL